MQVCKLFVYDAFCIYVAEGDSHRLGRITARSENVTGAQADTALDTISQEKHHDANGGSGRQLCREPAQE